VTGNHTDDDLAQLARELVALSEEDSRAAYATLDTDDVEVQLAWRRLTARNGDRLNEIMDSYGWPTVSMVGEKAARAAWKIAQHADRQLDVQRRALRLLEQAVAAGEASVRDLAHLRDRVLTNDGYKQIYGTQIAGVKNGVPVPWPCEDPERLDDRRAEVGIEPFAVHVAKHAIR
jgi:hypothetical protein